MTRPKFLSQIAAGTVIALAANSAFADTYNFSLTGDYTANWQLPSSPTPSDSVAGIVFALYDVNSGTFTGASTPYVDMYYWNGDVGGGIEIDDYNAGTILLSTDGPQLFTGDESTPTFLTGSFALTEYGGSGSYTLTITNVSAVPEPASYALLLGGLGAIGSLVARRRKG